MLFVYILLTAIVVIGLFFTFLDETLAPVIIALILAVGGFYGVRTLVRMDQTSDRRSCTHRAVESNHPTKFVYTGGSTYSCMTTLDGGATWISIGQVVAVDPTLNR